MHHSEIDKKPRFRIYWQPKDLSQKSDITAIEREVLRRNEMKRLKRSEFQWHAWYPTHLIVKS